MWREEIKEILLPHSLSFDLNGIPDNAQLNQEWWVYKDEQETSLGFGWIDFDKNEFGETEGELSLCVKSDSHKQRIGSRLLAFLEEEATKRGTNIISVVVKQVNPEHDNLVHWFQMKNYKTVIESHTDTYMVKEI